MEVLASLGNEPFVGLTQVELHGPCSEVRRAIGGARTWAPCCGCRDKARHSKAKKSQRSGNVSFESAYRQTTAGMSLPPPDYKGLLALLRRLDGLDYCVRFP